MVRHARVAVCERDHALYSAFFRAIFLSYAMDVRDHGADPPGGRGQRIDGRRDGDAPEEAANR